MKSRLPLIYCVIPNLNGARDLGRSIDSLLSQSLPCRVVVVDNGSVDDSRKVLEGYQDNIDVLYKTRNLGFAGGVNAGIKHSLKKGATFVALFNNDAVADKQWIESLYQSMEADHKIGVVAGKLLKLGSDPSRFDTTGDNFSIWGLAFPRGRGEVDEGQYNEPEYVFGATGGACMFRAGVFKSVGFFDKNFFAYYEDVDICFRLQLKGYRAYYQPKAIAWHKIGATSSKLPGFVAYHSTKNTLFVPLKNLPFSLLIRFAPRFWLAFSLLVANQIKQGNFWPVLKGLLVALVFLPKKIVQRWFIQSGRKVETSYIKSILYPGLPPDRHKLRALSARLKFWGAR